MSYALDDTMNPLTVNEKNQTSLQPTLTTLSFRFLVDPYPFFKHEYLLDIQTTYINNLIFERK